MPKPSSEAQLLEAKDGLQRMLVEIPLTDDERAAVDGDEAAVDRLLVRLADTPTPDGMTPRALNEEVSSTRSKQRTYPASKPRGSARDAY